jgi:hypothetical protein
MTIIFQLVFASVTGSYPARLIFRHLRLPQKHNVLSVISLTSSIKSCFHTLSCFVSLYAAGSLMSFGKFSNNQYKEETNEEKIVVVAMLLFFCFSRGGGDRVICRG